MEIQGEHSVATLIGAARALHEQGMTSVALLVFVTTLVSPFLQIASMLYILWPLNRGYVPPHIELTLRLVDSLKQWGMVEVFIIGVLVSLVKLAGIAKVVPGIAMWSFAVLIVLLAAAAMNYEAEDVWDRVEALRKGQNSSPSAASGAAV